VEIEFDPIKRNKALQERGLDFAIANLVFAGTHFTARRGSPHHQHEKSQ
jgi:hypothetical protein